jgi:TPR repeat protein
MYPSSGIQVTDSRTYVSTSNRCYRPKSQQHTPHSLTPEQRGKIERALAFAFHQTPEKIHQLASQLEEIQLYEPPCIVDGFYKEARITKKACQLCIEPLLSSLGQLEYADFQNMVVSKTYIGRILSESKVGRVVTSSYLDKESKVLYVINPYYPANELFERCVETCFSNRMYTADLVYAWSESKAITVYRRTTTTTSGLRPMQMYQSSTGGYTPNLGLARGGYSYCTSVSTTVPTTTYYPETEYENYWMASCSKQREPLVYLPISPDLDEPSMLQFAADYGNLDAQYKFGVLHYYGKGVGVSQNYQKAMRYFQMAAKYGHSLALNQLGVCHYLGHAAPPNYKEAVDCFRKAAIQKNPLAQCNLGLCYYMGHGVAQDLEAAEKLFRLAAKRDLATALYNLAFCLLFGHGVPQNCEEAIQLFQSLVDRKKDSQALLGLATCSFNEKGISKDYGKAILLYLSLAEQKSGEALYELAMCFYTGNGVRRDYAKAIKYFQLAADLKFVNAQFQLGLCHFYGHGVPQDYTEAIKQFRIAVDNGCEKALNSIGWCYLNGHGVPPDPVKAVEYFQLGEKYNILAHRNLGNCYFHGNGVPQNYGEAVKHFLIATHYHDAKSHYMLGLCYLNGHAVSQDRQVAFLHFRLAASLEDQEALTKIRTAAEQEDVDAQLELGLYHYGLGTPQDRKEAVRLFRLAAAKGNARAQYYLGYCLAYGLGATQDDIEAIEQLLLASAQKESNAQYLLGCFHYDGKILPLNYSEAAKYFRLAADQHPTAQYMLGKCYMQSDGVSKDISEGIKWIRLAAERGEIQAVRELGLCYYLGNGVPPDPKEAARLFRWAANKGDAKAQYALGLCYLVGKGVPRNESNAERWLLLAAKQGLTSAQATLGDYYQNCSFSHASQEAEKWLSLAAEKKDAYAIRSLALLRSTKQYDLENLTSPLCDLGFPYYGDNGLPTAAYQLGRCYESRGLPGDKAEAEKLFRLAACQGLRKAQEKLRLLTAGQQESSIWLQKETEEAQEEETEAIEEEAKRRAQNPSAPIVVSPKLRLALNSINIFQAYDILNEFTLPTAEIPVMLKSPCFTFPINKPISIDTLNTEIKKDLDSPQTVLCFGRRTHPIKSLDETRTQWARPTDLQKPMVMAAIASICRCTAEEIKEATLPLHDLLVATWLSPSDKLQSWLRIPCTAMTTCIIPCLKSLPPKKRQNLDFAYCSLEDDALCPLIEYMTIKRDAPCIRISRCLTLLEQTAMDRKVFALMGYTCFEPIYYVEDGELGSLLKLDGRQHIQLKEYYNRVVLNVHHLEKEKPFISKLADKPLHFLDGELNESFSTLNFLDYATFGIGRHLVSQASHASQAYQNRSDPVSLEHNRETHAREVWEPVPLWFSEMLQHSAAQPSIRQQGPSSATPTATATSAAATASTPLYRKPLPAPPRKPSATNTITSAATATSTSTITITSAAATSSTISSTALTVPPSQPSATNTITSAAVGASTSASGPVPSSLVGKPSKEACIAYIFQVNLDRVPVLAPNLAAIKLQTEGLISLSRDNLHDLLIRNYFLNDDLTICDFRLCAPDLPDLTRLFEAALHTNLRTILLSRPPTQEEEAKIAEINEKLTALDKIPLLVDTL